jgi:hypothetical protein
MFQYCAVRGTQRNVPYSYVLHHFERMCDFFVSYRNIAPPWRILVCWGSEMIFSRLFSDPDPYLDLAHLQRHIRHPMLPLFVLDEVRRLKAII